MPRFGSLVEQRYAADKQVTLQDEARLRAQEEGQDQGGGESFNLGQIMRGIGGGTSEAAPASSEELQARAQRNAGFLQQPEIQAAMLQFAINIMQPLGSGAGVGDLVGAIGSSIGAGAQAAGRYQLNEAEEFEAARKAELEEREMRVREGGLELDEAKLRQELKKGNLKSQTKVVSADSPENAQYGLGIPAGESATVEFITDQSGNIVSASVGGRFGEGQEKDSGTALQEEIAAMREAQSRGDLVAAQLHWGRAWQLANEFSVQTGVAPPDMPPPPAGAIPGAIPSIPNEPTSPPAAIQQPGMGLPKIIPGGPVDIANKEKEALALKEREQTLMQAVAVGDAVDNISKIMEESLAPDYLITGGTGALLSILPNVMPGEWDQHAREVSGWLTTVTSNVGLDQLQAIREASPTGGAVGQVSDYENRLLQATKANLDQFQGSPADLKYNLLKVKWLYDPSEIDYRADLSFKLQRGEISTEEAFLQLRKRQEDYIYPPELQPQKQGEGFNFDAAPDYLSEEDKTLWNKWSPTQKFYFLNEEDQKRALGQK